MVPHYPWIAKWTNGLGDSDAEVMLTRRFLAERPVQREISRRPTFRVLNQHRRRSRTMLFPVNRWRSPTVSSINMLSNVKRFDNRHEHRRSSLNIGRFVYQLSKFPFKGWADRNARRQACCENKCRAKDLEFFEFTFYPHVIVALILFGCPVPNATFDGERF